MWVSSKHQVALPLEAMRAAGFHAVSIDRRREPGPGALTRAVIALVVVTAGLLVVGPESALAADAYPCERPFQHALYGAVQRCPLFMPRQGSIPVHTFAANGQPTKSGRLVQAASVNWFVCQSRTPDARIPAVYGDPDYPQLRNGWWALTLSDDNQWGWVNEIYFRGGNNDEADAGLATCAAGVVAPRPTPSPSPPIVRTQAYTVGTFNMAGGHTNYGDRPATALALAKSITDRGADMVFLQEACKGMTDRLQNDLSARGWKVVFLPTGEAGQQCVQPRRPNGPPSDDVPGQRDKGSRFGIGIVYRATRFTLRGRWAYDLPSAGFEQRKMVCLDITAPRSIFACSTHFTAGDGKDRDKNRLQQALTVNSKLAPAISGGRTVFLGADLNTTPNQDALDPLLNPLYRDGARGPFVEVDSGPSQEVRGYDRDAGDPTYGSRKIDYIFARGVTVARADTGWSDFSDHRLLWAKVFQ